MQTSPRSLRSLLWLTLASSVARAQYLVEGLSFGYGPSISRDQRTIEGWQISGDGDPPQILSDRIVLTPPYPGNRRGALWAVNKEPHTEWTVDFEFRATGPDRGNGNLQLWYTQEGLSEIGTSSIYTVGKFDGLALVLDPYGGKGGSIRGFLNDGSTEYKNHHSVDSLAFGHCDYPYRNLGRPSHIQVKQTSEFFQVEVDNKLCFKSDKVRLPANYRFGLSAASAENPDSIEVNKFLVTTTSPTTRSADAPSKEEAATLFRDEGDQAASSISTDLQFADLHNRLQLINHQMTRLYKEVAYISSKAEERHLELNSKSVPYEQLNTMDRRLQAIENVVLRIQKDVEGKDYKEHLTKLQDALRDTHSSIVESLPQTLSHIVTSSAPRMGLLIFIVVVFQLLLAASYVIYKRRRANAPKKYL
ncbi:putative lectin family integral membrane protein [Xylona heveae TC161]|uniref:Putative lectin family integral membrane protein n=1 Tax=Xylona heveae (strain CBS 132557 / TC161) TaxID=1328760 RepID=A0A165FXA2_XYLHT|nr:putative lectin family integral membrane protein [Xylona heveae TC161]KZF21495.1 putative lectin family integral membrane protein [Xylona heveae TC161]